MTLASAGAGRLQSLYHTWLDDHPLRVLRRYNGAPYNDK
jgi:hypothetical protein